MMPASKHGDPQLGVDIHLCVVPPSPSPVPLPTPHLSVVFDPFDYVPIIGATISVCGMKRATAGTSGIAVHIPPGFPFAPMLPQKDDELFMGSATVVADGDPFSYIALPVLSCQVAGMPSIPRLRKKGPKKMMLGPLVFNLAIPTNVFVGGPPTISLMGLAMKGAFAGLGKLAKSGVFKRMRQKLFKNMNPGFLKCTILRAEPVNILSGAVSVEHEDFVLPGRIPIQWRRVYGSDNRYAGHCGHGWETPADGRLEINHDGVLMHYPGVGPLYFNGVPVAEGEAAAELELQDGAVLTDVDGEYRVRTKEDRIYHFPKRSMVRRSEGGQSIALSKIADLCGNHLQFERHNGVLTAIHESAGRRLEFRTDAGRIQRIGLITPESPERHAYVRYDYDTAGDLVAVRDALDHPYTFAYDAHHMVRHTDRNGLSFYYTYEKRPDFGRWVVHAWGDGDLYDYRFDYVAELGERRMTDSLGHVSIVKLNERGLPISEIDPLGGMTIYEYDDAGRTIGVTNQDGHRVGYEYDERGNLLKLVRPDGSCIETRFDAMNKPIEATDPNGAQWRQTWDARSLLVQQTSALGHVSRYEYDEYGKLVAFTNPRNARTELSYDVYGSLARVTDPLGHRTRFGYDNLGNLTGQLDPLGRKTLYAYDAKSRLGSVRMPSGTAVKCAYDPEGNLIEYIDESGAVTRLEYFGQGKVSRRVQPDGHEVAYSYDTEERLIGVRNQRGEFYQIKRDALGRIIEEVDYWGQSRCYSHSLAGHIRQYVDPLQRKIAFATDPLGRITKKTLPDPYASEALFEETFEYDAIGSLIAAVNPHVRIERSFDQEGRMLQEKQGDAFVIRNTYDEVGNRITRQTGFTHDGKAVQHLVRYAYDVRDYIEEIQIDEHMPIRLQRNAAGQVIAEQLSSELRREFEYGPDGHITRLRVHGAGLDVIDVGYKYDVIGNLIERRDTAFGVDGFAYDPMGRVTQHTDPHGMVKQYLNDPAGDRLQTRSAEQQAAAGVQRDWTREGSYEGTSYSFDRSGNLIRRADQRGELSLHWDASQRLFESRMNGAATAYRYDALGRRIEKRSGARTTRFAWDGDAVVADGIVDGGSVLPAREWVYFPGTFEPLVMLATAAGLTAILHYHNDPNGCPTRLSDSKGEIFWAAGYTAWGGIATQYVNAADQPLRLQGQYEDAETGLSYNRHRYYDPVIGQFLSRDPLGLTARENLYRIAPNVFRWVDPLGLNCEALKKATRARAKELSDKASPSYLSNSRRGPVVAGVFDPVTGRTFFDINADVPEVLSDVIAARIRRVTPTAESLAKHGDVGRHAEVRALNQAILAREAATGKKVTDAELDSFLLHNTNARGANPGTTVPPPCPEHCAPIVDGVTWVP